MNKVYGAILSPLVRKVLMVLEYKGIDYENIMVAPFRPTEELKKISPMGKIPAFVDDYVAIADSTVICDYIDNKYPQSSVYPTNPADRAQVLWLEEFADTELFEHLVKGLFFERVVAPQIHRKPTDEARVKDCIEKVEPALGYLERQISSSEFLVAGQLSIADLSVGSIFLNAKYAKFTVDESRWPRLAAYLEAIYQHPVFVTRIEEEADFW
jgi:glutathione S-transferase